MGEAVKHNFQESNSCSSTHMHIVVLCQNLLPLANLKNVTQFFKESIPGLFSNLTNTHGDFPIQEFYYVAYIVLVKRIFVGIFEEG